MGLYKALIRDEVMSSTSYRLIKRFDEFELRKFTSATILEMIENGSRGSALLRAKSKLKNQIEQNKSIRINDSIINGGIPEVMIEPLTEIKKWKFEFFLENYDVSLADLPSDIKLKSLSEKNYGTIKITGLMSNEKIVQKILLLKSWLAKEKCLMIAKPKIAIYRSPWKIPFLQRVEIYIEVEPTDKKS